MHDKTEWVDLDMSAAEAANKYGAGFAWETDRPGEDWVVVCYLPAGVVAVSVDGPTWLVGFYPGTAWHDSDAPTILCEHGDPRDAFVEAVDLAVRRGAVS